MGNNQPRSSLETRQATNRSAAFVIPLILVGAIGYATWVIVVLIGVHYLLHPGPNTNVSPRPGAAAAVIAIYFVLLGPMAVAYFRTVHKAAAGRGFVPQGSDRNDLISTFVEESYYEFEWPCNKPKAHQAQDVEKQQQKKVPGYYIHTLNLDAIFKGDIDPPPGTEDFYRRDVFQCDPNGLPIWCGTCKNWKPDRVHHCSDNGRCVLKLDHFCPWVGGVVSEANFKFFVQFNIYAMLYTAFVLIVMAVFVAEANHKGTGMVNVPWIIAVALGAMFFFFTSGMAMKSSQDLLRNLTTVDAIDHTRRTVFLAVKLRPDQTAPLAPPHADPIPWQGTIAYPFYTRTTPDSARGPRTTFAILCTPPGRSPWDLGPLGNWRSVMGDSWLDWLLPLRASPCTRHDSPRSMYPLGPHFDELLARAGIADPSAQAGMRGTQSAGAAAPAHSERPVAENHDSHAPEPGPA